MSDLSPTYFYSMACNNAWANHRLHGACSTLTQEAFAAKRTGFFPSIQETLNHILYVDWYYVDALEGGTLGPKAWENEIPHPDAAGLSKAQHAVDQRLMAFCRGLDARKLGAEVRLDRGKRIQVERTDRVLLHVFEHQIHHRGQAHSMLSSTKVKPPQLDEFFMADEASLRKDELAALGLDEKRIWGDLA